MLQKLLTDI